MQILLLSGVRGDTRRYRCFHPYEQLKLAGIETQLSHTTDPSLFTKAENASIFILHRTSYDPRVKRLLDKIEDRGGLAILDTDDLIFDPDAFQWIDSPDFQDPVRAALYREDMRRHQITLDACKAAIVSTNYLAERVRSLGKPVRVHRNAFSMEMLSIAEAAYQRRKTAPGRVVIGYASGTPTHNRDFAVAKPALKHILQRYPQTELWLVGPLDPGTDWGALGAQVKHNPLLPWRELPQVLAQFDINLAPLVSDNPFSQSKSEIKYVEAALVRVPTIASPTAAFQFAIQPGDNGYLATDTQDWTDALTSLIEAPEIRWSIGERAYAHTLQYYHPAQRAKELLSTLKQIYQSQIGESLPFLSQVNQDQDQPMTAAENMLGFRISPELEQSPSLAQMALYSLRYRGLRTLLMQVWIYFRRMLVPLFPYRSSRSLD